MLGKGERQQDEYKAIFESYLVVSNWNKYNKLIAMQWPDCC
jgi:hypothetical protein